MSVQVSYKKQFLFGLILLAIVFLIVEGISQIIFHDIQKDCKNEDSYFKDAPFGTYKKICSDIKQLDYSTENIRRNLPNQNLDTININSFGFRGDELNLIANHDEYRIIMVGGSTTFGLGSTSDHTTIPAFLEKKLNDELDFDIEVINAGIIAASSREEVFYIVNDLIKFNPDLILVFDGYNDSFYVKLSDIDKNDKYEGKIEKNIVEEFIRKNFKFLAFPNVVYHLTHDYVQLFYLTEDIKKENTKKWLERWNKMCSISEENDFELVVMLQPMLGTSDREIHEIEQKIVESPKHKKTLEFLNSLGDSSNELQCNSIDLRNTFDDINEHLFFSSVHTGDFGNEIIANKIYEKIIPTILEDIKK